LYFSLSEYTSKDRSLIGEIIFQGKSFAEEANRFVNSFHKILLESKKMLTSELFTLNDIRKFTVLRDSSHQGLEYSTVE
jgi:hypothetical protein